MKLSCRNVLFSGLMAGLVLAGCAPRYVITQKLEVPLASPGVVQVGAISDLLPTDLPDQDRPSSEDIDKFKGYLEDEIQHRDYLGLVIDAASPGQYEIQGRLLEYTKGSGFLRFMFGFGAGKAKVLTELKLVDLASGATIFSGNFEGIVTEGLATGDQMFKVVARDFTKELEKQLGKKAPATPAEAL